MAEGEKGGWSSKGEGGEEGGVQSEAGKGQVRQQVSCLLSATRGQLLCGKALSACAGVDIACADGSAGHACIVWHIKMNDPLSLRLGVNSPTLD